MFKAGIYRARIYGAGIYTGNGAEAVYHVFIPNLSRRPSPGSRKSEFIRQSLKGSTSRSVGGGGSRVKR